MITVVLLGWNDLAKCVTNIVQSSVGCQLSGVVVPDNSVSDAPPSDIPRYQTLDECLKDIQSPVDVLCVTDDELYPETGKRHLLGRSAVLDKTAVLGLCRTELDDTSASGTYTTVDDLRRILDGAHDGLVGIDARGRINVMNEAAARLIGWGTESALGEPVDRVIPNSRLMQVLESGRPEFHQIQRLEATEIITNRVPVFARRGRLAGAIAVFRDVTELRTLAAEITNLKEVQNLLEAVIQTTQDAISVVDREGRGILINPAYTKLTGLPPEKVIGKPADVDIAEGESMHMHVLKTGQPVKSVPLKVGPLRKEVLVDVAPLFVSGELRGSVGVIHDISEITRLTAELHRANRLIRTLNTKYTFEDIVGTSHIMHMAIEQAKQAATTPATVLLRGESGTGKELFAHAIHHASLRKEQAFVRVNCAALSEDLLESELFGYEEGAFTGARRGGRRGLFEEASQGTLFLDEIGEMSLKTQAKVLRAIQEREIVRVGGTKPIPVDVRLIAATHINLEQAVADHRFREDLYYRLNVIPIFIPPLRHRREDFNALTQVIVFRHNQSYGRNVENISRDAIDILASYHWPGNVREMENIIGRAMIHMPFNETILQAHHLPVLQGRSETTAPAEAKPSEIAFHGQPLSEIVRRVEQQAISSALAATHGNKTEAARRLGISVRTLYNKMNEPER